MKLNVFVDNQRDADSNEGKIPAGHEHHGDAEDRPEDGEGPVVILEAGPPIRRLEEGEQCTGNIDEAVAHQKEHTERHRELFIMTWHGLGTANSTYLSRGATASTFPIRTAS